MTRGDELLEGFAGEGVLVSGPHELRYQGSAQTGSARAPMLPDGSNPEGVDPEPPLDWHAAERKPSVHGGHVGHALSAIDQKVYVCGEQSNHSLIGMCLERKKSR